MNSRGYSIPKENEAQRMNCWVPATPNIPISSRVNPVPIQSQGTNLETSNWHQLLEFPNDWPLESMSSYQSVQDLDPYQQAVRNGIQTFNPNSFLALLGADGTYGLDGPFLDNNLRINSASQVHPSMHQSFNNVTGTLGNSNSAAVNHPLTAYQFVAQNRSQQSPQVVNRPAIPNLNVQASVDWIGNHSATMPMMNQNHRPISNAGTASNYVFGSPEDHFPVPGRVEYNLNVPARAETEPSFTKTLEFFHHASATINQATKSQEKKQCEILELPELNGDLSQDGNKQISVVENVTKQNSVLLQPNADNSSHIVSTPEKILGNEKEGGKVNDLEKTPHHKTPKRRKHRPKVIREGKPKKTPKSETPKNSKLSEKPKRKYTRKSSLNASGSQPSEVIVQTGGKIEEPATKSCRKALSFEQEKTAEQTEEMQNTQPEVMHQMSKVRFDLNLDNQDTEISSVDKHMFKGDDIVRSGQNESLPCTHPAQVIKKLAHSMPWGPIVNGQHPERPPPTQATTFQDLLTGSKNSAGSFTNVGNTTPNPKSQVQAMYSTGLYMAEEQLAMQRSQAELQNLYQRATTMENLNAVMPQQGTNINLQGVRHPPTQTNSFQELLMGNQNYAQVSARSKIVNVNQNNSRPYYPVQRLTGAENTGKLGYQTINSHNNLGEYGQKILSRSNHPVMVTSDQSETRRSKRERDFIIDQLNYNNNASISYSNASRVTEGGYQSEYAKQQILQEAEKKRRIENILHMEMSRTQSQHFDTIQSRQLLANMGNSAASMRTSHFNPYPWMSYPTNIRQSAEYSRSEGLANGVSTSASLNQYFNQHTSSGQPSNISQVQNRGNLTIARVSSSPISASNHNVQPIPAKNLLVDCQQSVKNSSSANTEKQYSRPTPSGLLVKTVKRAASPGDPQAITTVLTNKSGKSTAGRSLVSSRKKGNDYQPSSSSKRGQLRKKDIRDLVDELVHQMEHLSLDKTSENRKPQHENAIVPYIGDGPVVMYQAKKRKPRPKVDLDAESERIWKLLMGKEGPTEGTDVDKEKWWEQERNMFKLRATAFISRMHMVQGDRQFSKWKGSVVDSVIGVFLTQNVSDHLSSSAFMSLAARFPLSLSSRANWDDVIIEEEPEICIIDLEDTISNDDAKQILSHSHFVTSENEKKSTTSGTEIVNLEDDQIRGANNKTVSLDSFDNSICLTNRGSSSGSNSEVEEPLTTRSPSVLYKTGKLTDIAQLSTRDSPLESPERSLHHPEKPQGASEKECQQLSGGESTSSCHACDASECSSNTSDLEMQNRKNFEQNGQLRGKTEARPNLNEQLKSRVVHQQGILTSTPCQETTQHHYNDHHLKSQTFQSDKSSAIKEMAEPSSREKGLSSAPNINSKGSSPKTRNGKQDADIKTIDWDELRKEAQRKIKRSKNKNNMDSMDYETMRHAEVKEISDAIKERGMNNMLAERIKDFLNRLVKDHGSVDLEWLRDAPPDKAKDYLLSIRGLGLKSVECVRLLTLHHLAFPVDTNVGRIAVRLGWVPLQPLPESLQLHLLEMYPVLETIQKYLWPRLCKLDQRTLYELHYQMITFGKVFCTKSKPNCNACPMRAECRHFASAFASARLALPAPEERNIVPTRLPVQSDRSPDVDTPFPSRTLLEWDNQLFGLERFKKTNCEPIVEEPKTPEPEPEEVSEIDIEDSFGEDTEDIPTIQLDVPKFAQTLQSYIHDNNIDVQEKEMSNALVALTAEAASLPPQKLKNVSRLRTEHQVYELPDSHPLLSEMDKREPDDPSPYLLAIWTPGETPMSTQPPESRCQSDDPNKMCSEQTCFSCNSKREADSNIVRGTLLIPCRTAMRGSFPLNGTYFQVNEMFADHESSMNPIYVPREWIWNLPRRTVYFGTSVTTIFKGLSTQGIQYCFWRGFVCVRGFDQRYRAPRPLLARLHHPASKLVKNQGKRRNGRPVQDEE